jgi:hypothetical protein
MFLLSAVARQLLQPLAVALAVSYTRLTAV